MRLFIFLALSALIGSSLMRPAWAQDPAEAVRRRAAFEEAMRKVEEAEQARAERDVLAEAEARARTAQDALRKTVASDAATASKTLAAADLKRRDAQAFAGAVADKVPAPLRDKFVQPAPAPLPKVLPETPKGSVPLEPKGENPAAAKKAKAPQETIIDADGRLIFDGSGQFGKAYQVIVFEENVRLKHPQFLMKSDKLIALFKEPEAPAPLPGEEIGALAKEPEDTGNQLERAIATGREVTVTKTMESGEPQIAKARKATYYADREEVMLEIWPQVQRGRNLVMAKSKDTVIILKGEEMIVTGPHRTIIVGKEAAEETAVGGGKASDKRTVIDAERGAVFNRPSPRTGQKEVFFDGGVSVDDPGFEMLGGDSMTAYLKPDKKTGETVMTSTEMRGPKVEVREKTGSGRYGTARAVAFMPASGDIRLQGDPEIFDGIQHKKKAGADAVMFLNEKTNNVKSRGGGRSKIRIAPPSSPPG